MSFFFSRKCRFSLTEEDGYNLLCSPVLGYRQMTGGLAVQEYKGNFVFSNSFFRKCCYNI